mgnify:CR=1 FL=1
MFISYTQKETNQIIYNEIKKASKYIHITTMFFNDEGMSLDFIKLLNDKVKESGGMSYGTEGEGSGEWVLVDLGDVLVHIMLPAVRTHYDLEGLWSELETGVVEQQITSNDNSTLESSRLLAH